MEQYQQTATGTARHALQLPEDDPDDKIVDLILEDEDDPEYSLMIGDLIRRERHADVYSVYWYADACRDEASEARAFVLDGVPRKLKWHRKRCIQRLSPRTWCEASCRGAKVIIYKINNNTSVVTPEEEDTDSSKTSQSVLVPMKKTNYKREAARC
ncbi:hypothetical protein DER44DRAFT_364854 [Fusarium oxysporum]|nr:hypothetical protein DER44DRAFT_364854 [Fusarium oxysporum]